MSGDEKRGGISRYGGEQGDKVASKEISVKSNVSIAIVNQVLQEKGML
jgi:hypothetical protein